MIVIRASFILFMLLLSGCEQASSHQQRFLQFGTLIDVTVISDADQAMNAFDQIEVYLKQRHQQWHGWEDGTLKQFNDALSQQPQAGHPIPEILQTLIESSKYYFDLTDGLFNPAMGKLIAAWGFHDQSEPDRLTIQRMQNNIPGMDNLKIKEQLAYSGHPDLQLDFGAIAKGLAVKEIAQMLNQSNIRDFIINAGGDIYAQGNKPRNKLWRVAIEDPFEPGIVTSLEIKENTSIFTSGNYQRFFKDEDGNIRHHIINPKTGAPSATISSASVIHQDPMIADIAATVLMLTDIKEAKHMAQRLKIIDYLIINEQKQVFASPSMLARLDLSSMKRFSVQAL